MREEHDFVSAESNRRPFWRRCLIPFCVHSTIFLTYFILATLASDSWSRPPQQNINLVHCAFPIASTSHRVAEMIVDLRQLRQMKHYIGSCTNSILEMVTRARIPATLDQSLMMRGRDYLGVGDIRTFLEYYEGSQSCRNECSPFFRRFKSFGSRRGCSPTTRRFRICWDIEHLS